MFTKAPSHLLALLVLIIGSLGFASILTVSAQSGPTIDIWYGTTQNFGQIGLPQPWVNVLGNVSDPDGVASLVYSLNGAPAVVLSIGPDTRRLESSGDFNVDLAVKDLVNGTNQVVITATDSLGYQSQETVFVEFGTRNVWPLPYSIDWSSASNIQEVAQVVDGLWELSGDNVHTVIPGYDRLIAIGDAFWREYEVRVPITIHNQNGGCVGLVAGWNGHTDNPVAGWQPKSGWFPLGVIADYCPNILQLYGNSGQNLGSQSRTLNAGTPYIFKLQVVRDPAGPIFRFRVWEEGQGEPSTWDLVGQGQPADPQNGSMLLLAHEADVSFGNVTITPLSGDTTSPVISNIRTAIGPRTASISWTTDEAASSSVSYGPTAAYENGSIDENALVTEHNIVLTNLSPETTYHYQVLSVDAAVNSARSVDLTFTTPAARSVTSDDFNSCTLNTELWDLVDPLNDADLTLTGTEVELSVPAGAEHDAWTSGNGAPRLMQIVEDTDFEFEVKFDSILSPSKRYSSQGVFVEQDDRHFIRYEFHSDGSNIKFFVVTIDGGSYMIRQFSNIYGGTPSYMRVKREGDQWTMSYSFDRQAWTAANSFSHSISVIAVGPFAGNSADNPAHTAIVDYLFNTASPIDPEDAEPNALTMDIVGDGSVAVDPPQPTYLCGDMITLTADSNTGTVFYGWSGDLSGTTNPVEVTMDGAKAITATFGSPTAVEGCSLAATPSPGAVRLEWETLSELDSLGFHLYRASAAEGALLKEGALLRLNEDLIPSDSPGNPLGTRYEFVDQAAEPGATYYYWLEAVDVNGTPTRCGPVSAIAGKYRVYLPWIRQ